MTGTTVVHVVGPNRSELKSNRSEPSQKEKNENSYTLVASSVGLVSEKIRTNQRLLSTLATLQSYLPTVVSETAVKSVGLAQQLSDTYAKPIVERVDGKISNAIVTVLAVPQRTVAYGQEKISAVDQFAFSHTPEALKPTYTATRTKTLSVVHSATERVVALKRQRGDPLWGRLSSKLTQLSVNLHSVREALVLAGTNAVAVAHIGDRISELQAKIGVAVEAARAKGAQARALSQSALHSITDAAHSITAFVEASVPKQQAQMFYNAWSRVQETISSVKDTLQIGTPSTTQGPSPASSRSNSSASSLNFDEVESVPPTEATSGTPKDGDEHILADDTAESSGAGGVGASKSKSGKKGAKAKKNITNKAQQAEEQKQKLQADEDE